MAADIPQAPALTTEETYKKVLTAAGITPDVENVDDYSLLWLGSRTANSVILYIHGGGLKNYAYDAHIEYQLNGWKIMQDNKEDVSVAFLAYGTLPETRYPVQMRQAISATEHLLKVRPAEKISFSGDSAGGTLALAVLLHFLHPHPKVPALSLPEGSRFHEAFIVSAGSSFITSAPSMTENDGKDFVSLPQVTETLEALQTSKEDGIEVPNPWLLPVSAEESWWKGLPVGRVLFTAGGYELWRDDIVTVAERLKKHHDYDVVVVVGKEEIHCGPIADLLLGAKEDRACGKLWKEWFQNFKA